MHNRRREQSKCMGSALYAAMIVLLQYFTCFQEKCLQIKEKHIL